jgi:hypothetical protein
MSQPLGAVRIVIASCAAYAYSTRGASGAETVRERRDRVSGPVGHRS